MTVKKVIIIGAGWSGLAAAKTYLQINPHVDVTIIDEGGSVGGVWSKDRVHDWLSVDTPRGLYEFTDMAMATQGSVKLRGCDVTSYLEDYARHYDLLRRTRLNVSVRNIVRQGDRWLIRTLVGEEISCNKIIVSVGQASTPKLPNIPDDGFTGPVFHSKYFAKRYHLLEDPSITSVAVLGGCKSAIELAVACIELGKFVHWIIRQDGSGGVGNMIVTDYNRPGICTLNVTRIFNAFSPALYNHSGFWYSLLHSGQYGSVLFDRYWKFASGTVQSGPGYERSENGEAVRPSEDNVFWTPKCISIIDSNGPFLKYLHDSSKITVHKTNIGRLSSQGVHLTNGTTLDAGAVIYATGWTKSPSFFDDVTTSDLGLPIDRSSEDLSSSKYWSSLASEADEHLASLYPNLINNPPAFANRVQQTGKTPHRLYRNVIPPALAARGDNSIAFTGVLTTSQTTVMAELGAIYAVSYLEGVLPLPSYFDMCKDIALSNSWMRHRYFAKGVEEPLNLNEQSLIDLMMVDLGLEPRRKTGWNAWWKEWMEPIRPRDYKGMVEEFLANMNQLKGYEEAKQPLITVRATEMQEV